LARHHRDVRVEADALRGAAGGGRYGLARSRDDRSRAQSGRAPAAHPDRDRAAAGELCDGGRADPLLRHHALGAVGADHDQPRSDAIESLTTSVLIAVFTVAACLVLAVPAGYALARGRLPWRGAILLAFLLPQAIPSLAVYFNVARIFYTVGLNGTVAGVVLV